MIKELQRNAFFRNPTMAAAMQNAAKNEGAGPAARAAASEARGNGAVEILLRRSRHQ